MAHLVVFKAGHDGISAAGDARAGWGVTGHAVRRGKVVGLVIGDGRQVGRDILADLFELGFFERLDAGGDGLISKDDDWHAVVAGDIDRLDGGVKTILDIGRRQDNPRRIAVSAETGQVKVGLFDARRHAGGRTAPLHVNQHQWQLGHHRVAQGFGFQRNARTAGTGHRHAPRVARAQGHRNGGNLVLTLNKSAAVLGQLAPQQFHDVRPGCDRVAGAETNAGRDESVSERFVAVHHHLLAGPFLAFDKLECLEKVFERVTVAGVECGQGIIQNALILAPESLADEFLQFRHVQVEYFGDQA